MARRKGAVVERPATNPGPAGWSEAKRQRAREGGKRVAQALREAAQRRKAELRELVREAVALHFPGEERIPPTAGGFFFRTVACRCSFTEAELNGAARELGFWPWTPAQILQAFRERADARRGRDGA